MVIGMTASQFAQYSNRHRRSRTPISSSVLALLCVLFVGYWNSGNRDYPPGLERVVDYWVRYHIAKAVIAALLLIVLVVLGVRLWRALLRADRLAPGRGAVLASSGLLVAMLAVCAVVLVMVNIRDAVVPFASLISMLPLGSTNKQFTETIAQVRQHLAEYPAGGRTPPALQAMISDFARFHLTLAVIVVIVADLNTALHPAPALLAFFNGGTGGL